MAPFVYSYVLDPPERRPLASLVVYAASAAAVEGVQAMLPNPAVDTLLRRRLRSPHDFPYLFDYVMGVVAHGSLTEQVCRTVSSYQHRLAASCSLAHVTSCAACVCCLRCTES